MRKITLNEDDMGCEHSSDERVTCGTCQRNWCGLCNPTPSARCLYEHEHDTPFTDFFGDEDEEAEHISNEEYDRLIQEATKAEAARTADESDVHLHNGLRYSVNSEGRCDWYNCTHNVYNSFDEPEVDYEKDALSPREIWDIHNEGFDPEPQVGMMVCDCRYKHQRIKAIDTDGDTVTLEDDHVCSFNHCCDPVPHDWSHPCPVCREGGGFHNDDTHRKNIDPKYLLEKGWHQK